MMKRIETGNQIEDWEMDVPAKCAGDKVFFCPTSVFLGLWGWAKDHNMTFTMEILTKCMFWGTHC